MEQPQPIDLSKLRGILSGAKKVMNKVETGNYSTGHFDDRAFNEEGIQEMFNEGYTPPSSAAAPIEDYTADQVRNSNLPDVIKRAMIENPIPKVNAFAPQSFSLDDVADLQEKPMGSRPARRTASAPNQQNQRLNEQAQYNSNTLSVTKEQIREMVDELVNEKLVKFFMNAATERITESAVRKTLNALVKEGKLTAKKKII